MMTHQTLRPLARLLMVLGLAMITACETTPRAASMYGPATLAQPAVNPVVIEPLLQRAQLDMQRGHYGASAGLYQAVLRLSPRHPIAMAGLAQAQYLRSEHGETGEQMEVAEHGDLAPMVLFKEDGRVVVADELDGSARKRRSHITGDDPNGASKQTDQSVDSQIADEVEQIIRSVYGQQLTGQPSREDLKKQ